MQEWIFNLSYIEACILFIVENILIAGSSIFIGNLVRKKITGRLIQFTKLEIVLCISTILFNSLITLTGFYLWKNGWILIRQEETLLSVVSEILFLLLVMDFSMYWLHRVAHAKFLFSILHKTHHTFKEPTPIDLFALNPLEDIAFGILWLALLCVIPAGWISISIYLTLNVIFGITGHLGFEPVPVELQQKWWYKVFCFSKFHHVHHQLDRGNYGFYTTLWDRIFGTLIR